MEEKTIIPHRFTEKQFRRFEKYIYHAVEAYPQAVKCNPLKEMSQITFVARLRDAFTSYLNHDWTSQIDRVKFIACHNEIQVSEKPDGKILIGTKAAIANFDKPQEFDDNVFIQLQEGKTLTDPIILERIDQFSPRDLLFYLSHRRLLQPRQKIYGLSDTQAQQYLESYDIALEKNSDGSYTLI